MSVMPWGIVAGVVLWIVSAIQRRGRGGSRTVSEGCAHEWGRAEAATGWDQRCVQCGAWRSGYGRTWR